MGPIGVWEMVIILVVALIVFGPRKLPELGRSLGKSLGEFRRASNELRNTLDEEIRVEERQKPKTGTAPQPKAVGAGPSTPASDAQSVPAQTSATAKAATTSGPVAAATATAAAADVHPTEPDVGT
ncbi:MAG: twin-arginine translocase subunit TatB [Acidobacteria bacterium]|nr:twin-arginine translocase subunit TatB [Acidobacteriota bacterium]MXZ70469.1 twin-arginine translocase subunit TatB [Acidobacteriota bacterium]MYD71377.1 twin-arginine translocase subunit TatB [Acidobacteriota bacterium]MYJ05437.1 twin-arginine translocase subunit TatB [Acidobacteriota bacterium]